MPQLQTMGGRAITGPIAVVANSVVPLKLLPAAGERLPLVARIAGPGIAAVDRLNNRTGPNYATFQLRGIAPGNARLELSATSGGAPVVIAVVVQAAAVLPAADTDAGVLARLFLAESPPPGRTGYSVETSSEAMTLMRIVLDNRRATPSGRWASAGATSLADVVRARNQFEGFGAYPTLSAPVTARIDDMLAIANNSGDRRQATIRAHVDQAIAIASGEPPADPTKTGLYWWRTEGSGAPGNGVTLYKSVLGNSFYREGS